MKWRRVSAERYHDQLEVLMPAYWSKRAFAVGEAVSHDRSGRPTFQVFKNVGSSNMLEYFEASEPMTLQECEKQFGRNTYGVGYDG